MKPLAPLVLLIALVGCTPSKALEVDKPSDPTKTLAPSASTKTSPTPSSESSAPGVAPAVATPPATDETKSAPSAEDNPNRAFQLRSLQTVTVKVNGKSVSAWVMDSIPKQSEGMMFLTDKEVRDDQGMLFVYNGPRPKAEGFWMKHTILPLDIIFIAQNHKVLNIQKGKPQDETNLPPAAPYQYVLELKQGQAEQLGIKPDTNVDIPSGLRATDDAEAPRG